MKGFKQTLEEVIQVWKDENPCEDGHDHVTPFDKFFYGGYELQPPSAPDYPITATCRVCDYDYRCVPVPAKCGTCGTDLPPSAPVGAFYVCPTCKGPGVVTKETLDALAQQPADCDMGVLTPTGTFCSVCEAPQHNTPSGVSCPNGHGGVAALNHQPAAVDGSYPTPRNRAEAAALARLALAHLGVIDAHIDAAIARCETNSAAQPGGAE